MKRAWIFAVLVTLFVVVGLLWLLGTRKPAPTIPADEDHVVRREDVCLDCHPVGKPLPESRNHPISQRCNQCHMSARD